MNEPPHRATIHRALADAHRARIVDELDRRPNGLDVRELAKLLGVHPNTVRWHLGVLTDAGLVGSHPDQRTTPGRPRVVYTLRTDVEAVERENYRLLATIVTGMLSELPDADGRAFETGRSWGRYLVRRPQPGTHPGEADITETVVGFLSQEGFRAEATDTGIRMHRCPFRELVDNGAAVVCAIHHGLICGALDELGSSREVERLDAFVEPQLCIAELAPRTTHAAA